MNAAQPCKNGAIDWGILTVTENDVEILARRLTVKITQQS
jgi:F0F1-type ATP synthase epsilon subunit